MSPVDCKSCCLKCGGTGLERVEEFDDSFMREVEYDGPCDRCDGSGERVCDALGCKELATVPWPGNSDAFCRAHIEEDLTAYAEALAWVRDMERRTAKRAAQHDPEDAASHPAFVMPTPASEWPEESLQRLAKAVRR